MIAGPLAGYHALIKFSPHGLAPRPPRVLLLHAWGNWLSDVVVLALCGVVLVFLPREAFSLGVAIAAVGASVVVALGWLALGRIGVSGKTAIATEALVFVTSL